MKKEIDKIEEDYEWALTTLLELVINRQEQYPKLEKETRRIYNYGLWSLSFWRFNKIMGLYSKSSSKAATNVVREPKTI